MKYIKNDPVSDINWQIDESSMAVVIGLEGDEKKDYTRKYRTELTINNLLDLQK